MSQYLERKKLIQFGWYGFILLAILFKLYLIWPIPTLAFCAQDYDDYLFIRTAETLKYGEWLGAYNEGTLSKGPIYSLFIALASKTSLGLKVSEYLLYAFSVVVLTFGMSKMLKSKLLLFLLFIFLIFNPYVEAVTRVLRDNIYPQLVLLLLGLFCLLYHYRDKSIRVIAGISIFAGFAFFAYWYTREEGIWLLPLLALILIAAVYDVLQKKNGLSRRNIRLGSLFLFIPVFFLCQIYLKYLNYQHYGEFIALEINASYQEDAFNALYRVKQYGGAIPYMAINTATRQKIYSVSPSFRKVQEHLEKYPKRASACMLYPATCGEIGAGWFHWYFYGALAKIGVYQSASTAKNYYLTLTQEINAACDSGLLDCNPVQNQFLVHLRYLDDYQRWGQSIISGMKTLYEGTAPRSFRAYLTSSNCFVPERFDKFKEMTNSSDERLYIDPAFWSTNNYLINKEQTIRRKLSILTSVMRLYDKVLLRIFFFGSLLLLPILLFSALRKRTLSIHAVMAIGLVGVVVARIIILGLIDSTLFPGFPVRYVACMFPLTILLFFVLLDKVIK